MVKYQDINIIYEDNHIMVVEKPANMPVCEDKSLDLDLLNLLKKYIKEKYNKPGNVYLGLVHRLDRPVGGVMVFARTSKAASRLSKQIQENKFNKVYYAVVEGKTPKDGEFVNYLKKDNKKNMSYVCEKDEGKYAKLKYKTLKYKKDMSLVRIELETGRSHQIRVQFAYNGHPLVGDAKYNNNSDKKTLVSLFAGELSFYHPVTNDLLTFKLKMPKRYPFNLF